MMCVVQSGLRFCVSPSLESRLAVSVPRANVLFQQFISILSSLLQDSVPYIQHDTEVFPLPRHLCPPCMNDRQFRSSQEKGVAVFL